MSGSYGSLEWRALSFIDAEGLALRANQAAELTDLYHQGFFPRVRASDMSDVRTDTTSTAHHLRAVTQAVDVERIRTRTFTVAVDPNGGAASMPTRRLLEALGCDVVAINARADTPCPANPEPDETSLADLCELVRRSGADIGFAQDGDADRLAVVHRTRDPPCGRGALRD